MKTKWIVCLFLLSLLWSMAGCSQSAPAGTEEDTTELTEAIVSAPEAEETPEKQEAPLAENSEEPREAKKELTEEEKAIAAFLGSESLPEDMSPEEYEDLLALMRTAQESGNFSSAQESASANTPAEQPTEDPAPGVTPRTDEEVQQIVNNFVEQLKSAGDFSVFSKNAIEYFEENLAIIQNDPMSNSDTKSLFTSFQGGFLTEEEFIFALKGWLRGGGAYSEAKTYVY